VVQHVLRVVQLAGQGLAELVEQVEHVAPRYHAVGGHRQAACFLDHRDQRVERFEDPVHGCQCACRPH